MFGRPEWFKTRTISIRTPATFSGWLYFFGWSAAIAVPSWLFLDARRLPEAAGWLAISSLAFLWDRRHSRLTAATQNAARTSAPPEPLRTAAAPPAPAAVDTPHYIADAPPEITFVAERTHRSPRSWMPWSRRFRV